MSASIEIKKGHLRKRQYCRPLLTLLFFLFPPSLWMTFIPVLVSYSCTPQKRVEDQTLASISAQPTEQSPKKLATEGVLYFQRGAFDQAIPKFEVAAHLYAQEKNHQEQCDTLIQLSQAYQSIGQFENALQSSKAALEVAKDSGDPIRVTRALNLTGSIYLGVGQTDEAFRYLDESLKMSRNLGIPKLRASILNNLGNFYTNEENYDEAYAAYMESVVLSESTANHQLKGIALTNAATATMRNGQYKISKSLLDQALVQTRSLEDSRTKAYGLINIGLAYQTLLPYFLNSNNLLLRLSSESFNEAVDVSKTIDDKLALSYAFGYLGNLYENGQRYQEAQQLTRMAIFKAQEIGANEALFRWQWQAGRILNSLGKIDDAISQYRSSLYTLQSIRQERAGCYGRHHSTIRESTAQVSFELADLLLKRSASIKASDKYKPYLVEAREVVELQKIYELRNYYQDDCVDAARSGITRLDEVSKAAVIVYPIVLEDRTEVLFTLPDGLKRFSVKISKETLAQEVMTFRKLLEKRTTREFLPHAQKLYDWLIRPMESDLDSGTIDTMVFVPDGPMRTIPMAALHDGNQFLIEKYALAITPSLDLTDPKPISAEIRKALIFGLTKSVQGYPSLPYISSELQTIQEFYTSKLLLNQDFLLSNIEKYLHDEQYTILHIASHAQFGNEVDQTFLLTFDEKLSIDNLNQYIGLLKFRDNPLEILTLSACETAAGDDLAALGLAGLAIKAGARSALATLWHINDLASSILVGEFYRQLQGPSTTRAKALQRAQLRLIGDRRFQHPGYWSPFLLISNWL